MSDSVTIQMKQSKSTENYGVYDAPDEGDNADAIVGTYIATEAADQLGEYAALTVSGDADEAGLTLTPDKETASFGVYSDDADAVEATYISHEVLAEVSEQDADSDAYSLPDTVGMDAEPSDEDAFEQSADNSEAREKAADALLGGSQSENSGDESEPAEDATSTEDAADSLVGDDDDDSDEAEESEIPDEEVGIA